MVIVRCKLLACMFERKRIAVFPPLPHLSGVLMHADQLTVEPLPTVDPARISVLTNSPPS
jgi:hypothetical protein